MPDALLKTLLSGAFISGENKTLPRVPIKTIIIDSNLAEHAHEHLAAILSANVDAIALVCDKNTYAAMGDAISKSLSKKYSVQPIVFADEVVPDQLTVDHILQRTSHAQALVAVGSGTMNDLVKYASYLERKPYIIFGTAPSMNGYASANASIIVDGHKKTLSAHLPTAIFLDIDVCANAPKRLIASGVGDSLCRSTAQADWLLSHLLLGTDYHTFPFDLLKPLEAKLIENPNDIRNLCYTLILSGIGMYLCSGSYPASQGEHLIAHTMEMVYGDRIPKTYHGEEIAITTLSMIDIQERVLASPPVIKPTILNEAAIKRFFGEAIGKQCIREYKEKMFSPERVATINQRIEKDWPSIKDKIQAVRIPKETILATLQKAGAPTTTEALVWPEAWYHEALKHAHFTRNRFTFLDIYNQ